MSSFLTAYDARFIASHWMFIKILKKIKENAGQGFLECRYKHSEEEWIGMELRKLGYVVWYDKQAEEYTIGWC